MSQTIIVARINGQTIQISNLALIASGSKGVLQIRCEFDSAWDGYGKTGVFYRKQGPVYHAPLIQGVVTIPHEVMAEEGYFYFGIFGAAANTRTTEVFRLNVVQGAITEATAEPEEPTPNIYEQIIAAYGKLDTALAIERARVAELVAMRGADGADALPLSAEYITGTIYSNGASAKIEFTAQGLSLVAGGMHETDYCIPPAFVPLHYVEFKTSNPDLNAWISSDRSEEGWAKITIENPSTSFYDADMVTSFDAYFPLASVYLAELADLRVGVDGKTYPTAGEAVREQINQLGRTLTIIEATLE